MTKHNSMSTLRIRLKRFAFMLVKLIIVFGAGFFIYQKLIHNDILDFDYFMKLLHKNKLVTTPNIIFLLSFSLLNWVLESFKWKNLVQETKPISFRKAIEQSLGSLTASIITPNRIGEYGAKAMYFPKIYRKKILGLNLIGNLAQLSATIVFGTIGLLYVINSYKLSILYYKILCFAVLGILFTYLIYNYSSKKEYPIVKGYSLTKLKRFYNTLNTEIIIKTVLLSLLKYSIFAHQFYFLIWLFGLECSYIEAMAFITSMYMLVSIIPTIFVLDVLVKGSIAVWLFSFVGANEFVVLAITTLMWLFNFAFPAIVGSYFVLRFKFNTENK